MKKIIDRIGEMEIGVKDWLLAFSGIVFVRFLLEAISNPSTSGVIASDPQTLIHYALFYLVAAFGAIYIIDLFTQKGIKMANYMIFFLCFMWIAPILDIVFSWGKGLRLAYISDSGWNLLRDFLTFYGPSFLRGATPGIRIELILIIFGMAWFVWYMTKNIKKSVVALVVTYVFVFFITALPGIIYTFVSFFSHSPLFQSSTAGYLADIISKSNLAFNSIHATLVPTSYNRFLELGFDKLMSQFYFVLLCIFVFLWFWRTKRRAFVAILRNSRPERALSFTILIFLGVWFAFITGLGRFSSWVDLLGLLCIVISWYAVWVFSVNINDCEDLVADKISNKDRPLVQNVVTEDEMNQSALIFLGVSLLGSWSAGYYPFFMNLVFVAASYIYSVRPLRLKTVPMIATFLMAIGSLASVLAGFFFLSSTKIFYVFPPLAMFGILVFFTLFYNLKDLKDVEGDKADGSLTLPVIFGEKIGQQVIALMFAFSFLLMPIFFSLPSLYIISLPAAIIGYFLVIKFPRKEKNFFILYFVWLLLGVILYIPF